MVDRACTTFSWSARIHLFRDGFNARPEYIALDVGMLLRTHEDFYPQDVDEDDHITGFRVLWEDE
jgi:hypothetical protein